MSLFETGGLGGAQELITKEMLKMIVHDMKKFPLKKGKKSDGQEDVPVIEGEKREIMTGDMEKAEQLIE